MTTTIDPRTAHTRSTVLSAAAELIQEDGFERFNIDSLAKRSGVARSTIYRNWPDRHELLVEAFNQACPAIPPPDTGHLETDLQALADALAAGLSEGPLGQCLASLVSAAERDAEMAQAKADFSAHRRSWTRNIFQRAVERGEAPSDLDVDLASTRFVAPFFMRRLVTSEPLDRPFIAGQVAATLRELGR